MDFTVDLSGIGFDVGEIISACIGIVGVFIGAWIAKASTEKIHRAESVRQAYSCVFQKYMEWIPVQDVVHSAELCGAIYTAMLATDNEETYASLQRMLAVFSGRKNSPDACKDVIAEFWNCAKNELRK